MEAKGEDTRNIGNSKVLPVQTKLDLGTLLRRGSHGDFKEGYYLPHEEGLVCNKA